LHGPLIDVLDRFDSRGAGGLTGPRGRDAIEHRFRHDGLLLAGIGVDDRLAALP
jgi:hypothetical protein